MPSETITEKKEKSALNLLSSQQVKDLFEIGRRIINVKGPCLGTFYSYWKGLEITDKIVQKQEKVSVRKLIMDKKTVKMREGVRKKANYGQNDCQNKKKCP